MSIAFCIANVLLYLHNLVVLNGQNALCLFQSLALLVALQLQSIAFDMGVAVKHLDMVLLDERFDGIRAYCRVVTDNDRLGCTLTLFRGLDITDGHR